LAVFQVAVGRSATYSIMLAIK